MKRLFLLPILLASFTYASACTNLIVGKKASADGSVICSYSADSYGMFQGLCHFPASRNAEGTLRKVYDWDTNKYGGEIAEASVTYNVIGNINEHQLTIGETTFGGRKEMVDSTGVIDYGSLIYITLQRAKTAREAIQLMTTLVETYGYNSGGESFTICDPNEAWLLEMMGCGPDRNVSKERTVWVAIRIPDDAICAHANQSRITRFIGSGFQTVDFKSLQKQPTTLTSDKKALVMYSKNVVSYARKMGWYTGKDADFSYCDTYCEVDFSGRRICDARVWTFFNRYVEGFDRYLPYVLGKEPLDKVERMPLWVIPNRKVCVQDVEACMRDHYEGTPLALDNDPGQGLWNMPYRPTPLYYRVDGKKYFNERPISTQQAGFVFVSQMRSWLPREIGGVFWFANDDGNMAAFTPVYCSMTEQPECYNTPGADELNFSDKNAFWVCNWVSNMVYPRYNMLFPSLKEVRDSLEQSYFSRQMEVEAEALRLYKENPQSAAYYLNQYSVDRAQEMIARWRQLAIYLIVKFNDMVVKPEKDGKFTRTPYGLGSTPKRPGYAENVAKEIVGQTGDKFAVPQE